MPLLITSLLIISYPQGPQQMLVILGYIIVKVLEGGGEGGRKKERGKEWEKKKKKENRKYLKSNHMKKDQIPTMKQQLLQELNSQKIIEVR